MPSASSVRAIPQVRAGGEAAALVRLSVRERIIDAVPADLRDEWRKLDRIEHALADGVLKWSDEPAAGASHRADPNSLPLDVPAERAGLAHAATNSRDHA